MSKGITSISLRKDLKRRAKEAIETGAFPGIFNFSGLVEYALLKVLPKTKEASHEVDEVACL